MNSVEKDTNVVEKNGRKEVARPAAEADASVPAAADQGSPEDAASDAGAPGNADRPPAIDMGAAGHESAEQIPSGEQERSAEESTRSADTDPVTDDIPQPSVEEELDALKDRFMRQAAEFQNYRRRTEQEKARMMEFGKAAVVQQLLDVVLHQTLACHAALLNGLLEFEPFGLE